MYGLTARQKKLLKQHADCRDVDELPINVWYELVRLNDFEAIYNYANMFLWDQYMEKVRTERVF